ncbi:MAG TPA: Fe-S cluster assembly protein SufD [Longilinea sp.]|nr:Fe-S cluster assembly protein SufD [Longilinea sp.]
MSESPVVIRHTRQTAAERQQEFGFTQAQVPVEEIPTEMQKYRLAAWEAYQNQSIPTTREEAWRRTDLLAIPGESFHIPEKTSKYAPIPENLLDPIADEKHGGQIVLTPNGVRVSVDPELVRQGVIFTDLHTAEMRYPEILERIIGQVVKAEEGKFAAMAGALAQNGILLYVPRGLEIRQPLHSILWGPGGQTAYFSHLLVLVDEGASVTLVHESASPTEKEPSLHAGLVEIMVNTGAKLNFVELQSWGQHVWNFSHERAHVAKDATLDWIFGAIGSHLTKNFSSVELTGRGATGRMSGFYFTDNDQHLDHDTQQDHLAPNTTSDLLFKGALLGSSRSVWQGMIYVAPGAAKTDGYQANRNLVLSRNARADSLPGLEILADDVRCTHGATVGKIDADQVFYLRSRGIPEREAQRLIVEGFFDPIMQRIPFEGVRNRFQASIHEKMGQYSG